ncbi:glycoside hydrolase family 70 protein [Leuconostoc mesenteroides]|uniref:glycoside hydrolase family 70 protein n=1 Tax=Leuconostoc mesenteroides TaxID=1245 RepID=UPI0009B91290|nr:glycoside hydrolase family 70 protein [Leuconostoc mesenteroides]
MRKRMYKAGKSWVVATATFATAAMVSLGHASANDVTVTQNNAAAQAALATTNTNTTSDKAVQNITPGTATADNTAKDIDTTADNVLKNQYKENSNGSWFYYDNNGQIVKGLQTINGNIQYFDPKTGEQVKGQTLTIDGIVYTFDKDSGNGSKTEVAVANLPKNGSYTTNDGSNWQYQDATKNTIKGLYSDNGSLRYFNGSDGTQSKGAVVNVNNNAYYFDKDSGNGELVSSVTSGQYGTIQLNNKTVWVYRNGDGEIVKGLQNINGNIQYFDPTTGEQVKGGIATVNGVTYYFEPGDGNLVGTVDNGLVNVNGRIQYFDPATKEQAKNKQVSVNNVTYYFDDNGNGEYLFTNVTSTNTPDAYSSHTQVYDTDKSTFTNVVDGFLTADSWYRPKEVIGDETGSTWKTSSENDYRPILTVWWPNKNIEVSYLKLMQDNDLLSKQTQFTIFSDQNTLNEAAQAAQNEIEKRIYREKSTDWLKDLLFASHGETPSFVKQQFIWNKDSEYEGPGSVVNGSWALQGGYLKYIDSPETSWADSNARDHDYFEYLLGNDIDNSNPQVMAEDINWLYYLMNFGSLTGNDDTANFDGVRMDAVIYMKGEASTKVYQFLQESDNLTKNEKTANEHISIVEDGTDETKKNNSALIVSQWNDDIKNSLAKTSNEANEPLSNLLLTDNKTGVNYLNNSSIESNVVPNYSMIRSHDRGSQDEVIAAAKVANNDQRISLDNINLEQLEKGLKYYYEDQLSSTKHYNYYNIPASYALLLSNKDTVPRVYYSDMYQDYNQNSPQQYMSKPTIYYSAIDALLKARIKYVAGGQSMSVAKVGNEQNQEVLTSVRYGKNIMNSNDLGTTESRTEGMGVIVSNDTDLKLSNSDQIVLHMGAAHSNQAYQALMLTNNDGIQIYNSNAPVVWTNQNGDLVFEGNDIQGQEHTAIKGYLNPQVAGYFAVWVPVGASETQDARTDASTDAITDGKVFHSNAALDSNVMYEGFSNFQPITTNHNEFTNVKIAENVDLFKSWGITSFELAPQYRSADVNDLVGATFVDVVTKNGYGLSDRYDLGFDTPTKYGTDSDLRNAISSLHEQGIQSMADFVANQIYALNDEKEVVTAQRTDMFSNTLNNGFGTELYVVNSVGGGAYQNKYGGKYLEEINKLYPDLFKDKNGNTIDTNTKIKQWSAKYMNGTNVLGRGMGYVLKDWNTGTYFKLDGEHTILPTELEMKSQWIANADGTYSYYDQKISSLLVGNQIVDGQYVYFDKNGVQVKGKWAQNNDGTWAYYDANKGDRVVGDQYIDNHYIRAQDHSVNASGYLFDNATDQWAWFEDGQKYTGFRYYMGAYYYFKDGVRQENSFETAWGNTYYVGSDGRTVQGKQVIGDQLYDFGTNGTFNLKSRPSGYLNLDNGYKWYENGQKYTGFRYHMDAYYFFKDGIRQENSFETAWGKRYYVGNDGRTVQGIQTIDGKQYYFGNDNTFYLRTNAIQKVGDQTFKSNDNGMLEPWIGYIYDGSATNGGYRWYEKGQLFTGFRYYVGSYYWFVNGVRQNAGWHGAWGHMYYTDKNGRAVQGIQRNIPDVDGIYRTNASYNFGNDGTYYLR